MRLAAGALWLAVLGSAAPAPFTLGTWPTIQSEKLAPERIELELGPYRHERYGELSRRRAVIGKHGTTLVVDLRRLRVSLDAVKPQHRRCSFSIDCDEPSVRRLLPNLLGKRGKTRRASPDEIARFVNGYIVNKTLARGLDLPSATAVSREGDCTEHAMLLVALARMTGYAARVVFGLAVVEDSTTSSKAVFGHAWAEVHDGRRWSLLDAALLPRPLSAKERGANSTVVCVSYVPLQIVVKEGPEFPGLSGFHPTLVRTVAVSSAPIRNAGVCSAIQGLKAPLVAQAR